MHHYVDHEDIGYGLFNLKCRDCEFAVQKVETRFVCDIKQSHRIEALESMVETLIGDNADLLAAAFAVKQGREEVARRQREYTAKQVGRQPDTACECEEGLLCSYCLSDRIADVVRNTRLVTDDNP